MKTSILIDEIQNVSEVDLFGFDREVITVYFDYNKNLARISRNENEKLIDSVLKARLEIHNNYEESSADKINRIF